MRVGLLYGFVAGIIWGIAVAANALSPPLASQLTMRRLISWCSSMVITFTLCGLALGFILWWLNERRFRVPPGHCPNCDYDLTGNVSGVCPECGERI